MPTAYRSSESTRGSRAADSTGVSAVSRLQLGGVSRWVATFPHATDAANATPIPSTNRQKSPPHASPSRTQEYALVPYRQRDNGLGTRVARRIVSTLGIAPARRRCARCDRSPSRADRRCGPGVPSCSGSQPGGEIGLSGSTFGPRSFQLRARRSAAGHGDLPRSPDLLRTAPTHQRGGLPFERTEVHAGAIAGLRLALPCTGAGRSARAQRAANGPVASETSGTRIRLKVTLRWATGLAVLTAGFHAHTRRAGTL